MTAMRGETRQLRIALQRFGHIDILAESCLDEARQRIAVS